MKRAAASPRSPADAERPNPTLLAALGHELHGIAFDSSADAKEALKRLAAETRVAYDGASIAHALDLIARSRRPLWVGDGTRKRQA